MQAAKSYKAVRREPPVAFDPAEGYQFCTHNYIWVKNEVLWVQKYDQSGQPMVDCYGRPQLRHIYKLVYKCSCCGQYTRTTG